MLSELSMLDNYGLYLIDAINIWILEKRVILYLTKYLYSFKIECSSYFILTSFGYKFQYATLCLFASINIVDIT